MIRHPTWTRLVAGVAAIAAVAAVALAILIFGRVGSLRGKQFTLYVTTATARGVIRGSNVWLDGQKVGLVRDIVFRPPSVPDSERLVIVLDMLDRVRPRIRRDSRPDIRSGLSIIGDQVVYLTSGTSRAAAVSDGDTLHSATQSDVASATATASVAARQFPAIMDNVKLLSAQLRSASGTLGALGVEGVSGDLARLHASSARAMRMAANGRGSMTLARADSSALRRQARTAVAEVDSIRALVSSNQHSLGRFRRDSTLQLEMGRVRADVARVGAELHDPRGTAGRLASDSALTANLSRARQVMDSLFADVKKHPFRYIAF
jgi:phospholipid/cholesterol/gamma-HCH transport system substrate-binding protein